MFPRTSGRLLAFSRRSRSRRTRAIGWLSTTTNMHQTRRRWRWFSSCLRSNRSCRSKFRQTHPGMPVQVRIPDGRIVSVPIPEGTDAGQTISVAVTAPGRRLPSAAGPFRSRRRRQAERVSGPPLGEEQCAICQEAIRGGHERLPCSHMFHRPCLGGGSETGSTGSALFVKHRLRCSRQQTEHGFVATRTGRKVDAPATGPHGRDKSERREFPAAASPGPRSKPPRHSRLARRARRARAPRPCADLMLEAIALKSHPHERDPDAADERQLYVLEFLHDDGANGSHRGAARFTAGREHFVVVLADEMLRTGPHFTKVEALDAPSHVAGRVPERQVVGIGFGAPTSSRGTSQELLAPTARARLLVVLRSATSAAWSSWDRSVRTEMS